MSKFNGVFANDNVYVKKFELSKLQIGDKVKLTTGQIAEFKKLKRTKFIGMINDKLYDIHIEHFESVIEKAASKKSNKDYETLQKNEPFYINHKGNAEIYLFEEIRGDQIIGRNVITEVRARISLSMYVGKVSSLLKQG